MNYTEWFLEGSAFAYHSLMNDDIGTFIFYCESIRKTPRSYWGVKNRRKQDRRDHED